jgi:hypothetical protein
MPQNKLIEHRKKIENQAKQKKSSFSTKPIHKRAKARVLLRLNARKLNWQTTLLQVNYMNMTTKYDKGTISKSQFSKKLGKIKKHYAKQKQTFDKLHSSGETIFENFDPTAYSGHTHPNKDIRLLHFSHRALEHIHSNISYLEQLLNSMK